MTKLPYEYNVVEDHTTESPESTASAFVSPPTRTFNRRSHNRRMFWTEICWRLAASLAFGATITVILYSFSKKGTLSRWEKRWFNVLAILFSSLMSLSLGSLLSLLGSMLRWPLLARKLHRPADVDLILWMPNLTGAVTLIWKHTVQDRNWSGTTVVVAVYLLVNIIGRLSVAAIGLTFDLNEQPGIDYPINITDWSTADWFNQSTLPGYGLLDEHIQRMDRYATVELSNVPEKFDSNNLLVYNATNITDQGLDRVVHGNTVTYSYHLKEYRGLQTSSSKTKVLHSSSTCVGRSIRGSNVYNTDGQIVGNLSPTEDERPEFINLLFAIFGLFPVNQNDYLWTAPLDYSKLLKNTACATTYIYLADYEQFISQYNRNATLFECSTCISDKNNEPGIGSDELSGSPSKNSSVILNLLNRIGVFERVWEYDYAPDGLMIRVYSVMDKFVHFSNALNSAVSADPPLGLQAELFAAHLTARVPLLAILGADEMLPRGPQDPSASERKFVDVTLEVQLRRPIAVVVSILVGQVLAICIVQFVCRKTLIRDYGSYVSISRLFKTAMSKVDGMSTHSGQELIEYLDKEGVMMKYGTRWENKESLEVDLWDDVENVFPDATYT